MAYYLQMDGVDDRLQLPTMSATKVIIDCYIDSAQDGSRDVVLDTRTGSTFFLDVGFTNMRFKIDGGSEKASHTDIPKDSRHSLEIYANAAQTTVMTDNFTLYAKNDGLTPLKGNIYSVTIYNLTTLVASYDLTLGNAQDQSGNGYHATLTGGTWVSDSSGETHNGAATLQGVSTISAGATLIPAAITGSASLQGVGNLSAAATVTNSNVTASASLQGVGALTANGSVVRSASANMIGVSALSVAAAGLTVNGAASFTGVGWLMAEATAGAQIISAIDIYGEYDFVLDIAGELSSVADTLGEMEPLTVDILGVIGMAIQNADISIYRGNDKDVRDTVRNTDGTPTQLSGASVKWLLKKRQMDTVALFEKSTPSGITITDPSNGVFVVHLTGAETDVQHGRYFYAAKVTDALGKTTTVSEGSIVIKP